MSMSRSPVPARLLPVFALVVVTSCGSTTNPGGAPERAESSATTHADDSWRMCSQADEGAQVLGAWPTTVEEVRARSGGPPPGHSPASGPWADLPDGAKAAWCTFHRHETYVVSAATANAPLVDFMTSKTPVGEFPNGPAIP